jgi:hypothetical protein
MLRRLPGAPFRRILPEAIGAHGTGTGAGVILAQPLKQIELDNLLHDEYQKQFS